MTDCTCDWTSDPPGIAHREWCGHEPCDECGGTQIVDDSLTCPRCKGSGFEDQP